MHNKYVSSSQIEFCLDKILSKLLGFPVSQLYAYLLESHGTNTKKQWISYDSAFNYVV